MFERLLLLGAAALGPALLLFFRVRKQEEARRRRELQARKDGLRSPLDYEAYALEFGNPLVRLYYGYTSGQGSTLKRCRQALDSLALVPRAMRGMTPKTSSVLFGKKFTLPLFVAPTALHKCAHPTGEVGMARGAGKAGVGYCYNYMLSSKPLELVAKEPGEKWLHMYIFEERELVQFAVEECLEKYKGVFSAIIVTVDHPHNRVRDTVVPHFAREALSVFANDDEPYMPNIARAAGIKPLTAKETFSKLFEGTRTPGNNDGSLTWKDLKWLANIVRGRVPIVAKGILHPEDALLAVEHGADGIVVSNHGGRQMDGAITSVDVLSSIVTTVRRLDSDKHIVILADTGVRTSADILRLIALGADGVLMGRPPLYALAADGADGVERMFKTLIQDVDCDMRCLGWADIAHPPEGVLARVSEV